MSKKRNVIVAASSLLMAGVFVTASIAKPAADCGCTSASEMRDMTTQELVLDMGLGINLGNTFEAACDWRVDNCYISGSGVNAFETAWGSPTVTEGMIKGYADAGFKTVRIPVAWSNLMTGDALKTSGTNGTYTISAALLNRVAEVVDWVLGNDMYAIVNIHWDGGWWKRFFDVYERSGDQDWGDLVEDGNGNYVVKYPADSAEAMRKYTRIWEQISEKFKTYGDRLIFASLNEEGGWNDIWYEHRNKTDLVAKQRVYGMLNAINQQFVNVVRASGDNNADRHLQIQGYHTNIDLTIDDLFKMPTDPRVGGARLAVSVHYYEPFGFTHLDKDESWAQALMTWGTRQDEIELDNAMDKLVNKFVNNGVPVIIGEYGFASSLPRDTAQVRNYTLAVTEAIYKRNMLPVLWDVQLNESDKTPNNEPRIPEIIYYYDRHSATFRDPLMVQGFAQIAAMDRDELTSIRQANSRGAKPSASAVRPQIVLRGKTLSVSSPSGNTEMSIKLIDVKGKVRANFNASGRGVFSLARVPAGRYFVEVKGAGVRGTVPVVVR